MPPLLEDFFRLRMHGQEFLTVTPDPASEGVCTQVKATSRHFCQPLKLHPIMLGDEKSPQELRGLNN